MSQQTDRTWQYGQTAATLLVAYMLVLQGLAVGFVTSAKSGPGTFRFANSICLKANAAPSDNEPAAPSRSAHCFDVCCVLHCSGLGAVAGFVEPTPPTLSYRDISASLPDQLGVARREPLPVGARAPPSLKA